MQGSAVERMEVDPGSIVNDDPGSPGPPILEDQHGMEVTHPVQKSAKTIQNEIRQRLLALRDRYKSDSSLVGQHTLCAVCKSGLRDPVVSLQCLHTYCNLCWTKHSHRTPKCPACDTEVEATKPLLSIRAGTAVHEMVYRLLSGGVPSRTEQRASVFSLISELDVSEDGLQASERILFTPEDQISMSIEYYSPASKENNTSATNETGGENGNRRFLQCSGSMTVACLKKFIINKYSLDQNFLVDVLYNDELLAEDQTIMDIAYAFDWKKTSPMQFFYQVYQRTKLLTRKRKKKRTKAGSKRPPPAKRMRMETAPWKSPSRGTNKTAESAEVPRLTSRLEQQQSSRSQDSSVSRTKESARSQDVSVSRSQDTGSSSTKLKICLSRSSEDSKSGKKSGGALVATVVTSTNSSPVSSQINSVDQKRSKHGESKSKASPSVGGKPSTYNSTTTSNNNNNSQLSVGKTSTSSTIQTSTASSNRKGSLVTTTSMSTTTSSKQSLVSKSPSATKTVSSVGQTKTVSSVGQKRPLTGILKNSTTAKPMPPGILKSSSYVAPAETVTTSTGKSSSTHVTSLSNSVPRAQQEKGTDNSIKPISSVKLPTSKTVNSTEAKSNSPAPVKPATTRATPPLKPISKPLLQEQKKPAPTPQQPVKSILMASKPEKQNSGLKSILKDSASKKKEVVEISVEVSASDVKKVLEKKKAEKDSMRLGLAGSLQTAGSTGVEDKLYSNYSIVDQIKKAGSSALARHQTEQRASMMDFTRSGDALSNIPKVPPTIQGLQPKIQTTAATTPATNSSESTALSTIVQNLAQKQQKLQENGVAKKDSVSSPATSTSARTDGKSDSVTKTLATMVSSPVLTGKTSSESSVSKSSILTSSSSANKVPVSTSNRSVSKPVTTMVESGQSKHSLNFYKSNMIDGSSLSDAVKSAEKLTKNIPAGTTVTVKTVDNKSNGKASPVTASENRISSPKSSLIKQNSVPSVSVPSSFSKSIINPFSSVNTMSTTQSSNLINQFHNSLGAMALAAQLNMSQHPVAALAAAAQVEAAMRVAQAAASLPSAPPTPITTLNFTKPTLSGGSSAVESSFGLKIPTPPSRTGSPAVSGFGNSRLQVKVNSDTPKPSKSPTSQDKTVDSSPTIKATHTMPAILPFPTVKKAQAIPKASSQNNRPSPTTISSLFSSQQSALNSKPSTPVSSLTDANSFKTTSPKSSLASSPVLSKPSTPPAGLFRPVTPAQVAQVNSLKKLAEDLNSVQQKSLKGDYNILNTLKKNSGSDGKLIEKKLIDGGGVTAKEGMASS